MTYQHIERNAKRTLAWCIFSLALSTLGFAAGITGLVHEPQSLAALAVASFAAGLGLVTMPWGVVNLRNCWTLLAEVRALQARKTH